MLRTLVPLVALALPACGSSTPTPAQQATLGTYEAALQACVLNARAMDASLATYTACADQTDRAFGRVDGGADGSH